MHGGGWWGNGEWMHDAWGWVLGYHGWMQDGWGWWRVLGIDGDRWDVHWQVLGSIPKGLWVVLEKAVSPFQHEYFQMSEDLIKHVLMYVMFENVLFCSCI